MTEEVDYNKKIQGTPLKCLIDMENLNKDPNIYHKVIEIFSDQPQDTIITVLFMKHRKDDDSFCGYKIYRCNVDDFEYDEDNNFIECVDYFEDVTSEDMFHKLRNALNVS